MKYIFTLMMIINASILFPSEIERRPLSRKFFDKNILTFEQNYIYDNLGNLQKIINKSQNGKSYILLHYVDGLITSADRYDNENKLTIHRVYLYGIDSKKLATVIQFYSNTFKIISLYNYEYNKDQIISSTSYYHDSDIPYVLFLNFEYINNINVKVISKDSKQKIVKETIKKYDSDNNLIEIVYKDFVTKEQSNALIEYENGHYDKKIFDQYIP